MAHTRALVATTAALESYDIACAANPWRPGQAVTLEHARLATAQIRAASAKRYWLERAITACREIAGGDIGLERAARDGIRECIAAIRALLTAEDPAPIDAASTRRAALDEAAAAIHKRMLDHRVCANKLPEGPARAMEIDLGCEAALCWEDVNRLVEKS